MVQTLECQSSCDFEIFVLQAKVYMCFLWFWPKMTHLIGRTPEKLGCDLEIRAVGLGWGGRGVWYCVEAAGVGGPMSGAERGVAASERTGSAE